MNNAVVVPVLVSSAVLLVVYMIKKDEEDDTKKPNYPVLFFSCLALTGGIMFFTGAEANPLDAVMKEIDVGDAPF
jgi:hypothetical protein